MKRLAPLLACLCMLLLAACASGPPRRVSDPAASIQQLSVRSDGSWSVELRIENFSSVPMRFDAVDFALVVGDSDAGRLQGSPALDVGPESADVATVVVQPTSAARIAMADALAAGRGTSYSLLGTITAADDRGRVRTYDYRRSSALSPVPGLPGVLR